MQLNHILHLFKRYYYIVIIVVLAFFLLVGLILGHVHSVKKRFPGFQNYISIANAGKLYYSGAVSANDARRVAQMFFDVGFFGSNNEEGVAFLDSRFNKFSLIVPFVDNTIMSDIDLLANFMQFEHYLNENSGFDTRIEIAFSDFYLTNIIELPNIDYLKVIAQKHAPLQVHAVNCFHNILYNEQMPSEHVRVMEKAMRKLQYYFPKSMRVDVFFLNQIDNYCVKLYLSKVWWNDKEKLRMINEMANYIEYSGVDKLIEVVLIDNETNEETKIARVRD